MCCVFGLSGVKEMFDFCTCICHFSTFNLINLHKIQVASRLWKASLQNKLDHLHPFTIAVHQVQHDPHDPRLQTLNFH